MAEQLDTDGQITFDYGHVMDMASAECTKIDREVVTDTYSSIDGDDDEMIGQLDRMMTYMYEKRHGFVGYLSFCYAQITMLYLLERYHDAAKSVDMVKHGISAIERFLLTGNYNDESGKPSGFKNFSCGESAEELETAKKFSKDTFDTARLVHSKASSFESAFSLAVAGLMYHLSVDDLKSASDDCSSMNSICERLRKYLVSLGENKAVDVEAKDFTDYGNIEDIQK